MHQVQLHEHRLLGVKKIFTNLWSVGIQIILLHYKTILKMQLDLVNDDYKYNNAFSFGSVCL